MPPLSSRAAHHLSRPIRVSRFVYVFVNCSEIHVTIQVNILGAALSIFKKLVIQLISESSAESFFLTDFHNDSYIFSLGFCTLYDTMNKQNTARKVCSHFEN